MSCADPKKVRASAGTAAVLGLIACSAEVLPTTAYFLLGSRCRRDCAFCPQARSSRSRADLLSRVTWPEVALDTAIERLASRPVKRVCLQLTDSRDAAVAVDAFLGLAKTIPVCVSATGIDLAQAARLLRDGVERITLPLDAATPEIYAQVKGQPRWDITLRQLEELAMSFPGRVGTHLVAGLGESEEEFLRTVDRLVRTGLTVGVFAFTPVAGTKLANRPQPPLDSYRRLQVGHHLLRTGKGDFTGFRFREGRLVATGLDRRDLAEVLADGEAFRTSGCPDCNRPYYNERPGGTCYNYPRPLTAQEASREVEAVVADLAPRRGGLLERRWRLVISGAAPAAWNMAVDEAMALVHARGLTPPTLRLYAWNPPAVSVGYAQSLAEEVDLDACLREGVQWVRRPSGGRAILHDREITYCVIVSQSALPGDLLATYRELAEGLREALRELGLEAVPVPRTARPQGRSSACFEVPSAHELVVAGRKVVGSAQVRRAGVILQHGSLLLQFEPERLVRLLKDPSLTAERLRARAAGVGELLGRAVGWEEAARALQAGFARGLHISFSEGCLCAEELELAATLRARYETPVCLLPPANEGAGVP